MSRKYDLLEKRLAHLEDCRRDETVYNPNEYTFMTIRAFVDTHPDFQPDSEKHRQQIIQTIALRAEALYRKSDLMKIADEL